MKIPFIDVQNFLAQGSRIKKCGQLMTNAKISYILGLKSYKKDTYNWDFSLYEAGGAGVDSVEECVYSCQFGTGQPYGSYVALCYEDGSIIVNNTRKKSVIAKYTIKNTAAYDISWVPNAPKLVSASQDCVDKWTIAEDKTTLVCLGKYNGHTKSVTTVDVNPWDPDTFASGSRDGSIIIWDSRCQPRQKAAEINAPHYPRKLGKKARSHIGSTINVSSVKFVQNNVLASAGSSDGCVKLWDMRKTYNKGKRMPLSLHTFEYPGTSSHTGYTSLSFSANKNVLYTSCMDNKIYAYHLAYPITKPVHIFSSTSISSYYVKSCVSPCGSYLLCGSNDYTLVWLTEGQYNCTRSILPIARLCGHSGEVTNIAWSNDGRDVVLTSGDDMKCHMYHVLHSDPDKEKDPDLSGYAMPLQNVFLRRPILRQKRDECYVMRPVLDVLPGSLEDHIDSSSSESERVAAAEATVMIPTKVLLRHGSPPDMCNKSVSNPPSNSSSNQSKIYAATRSSMPSTSGVSTLFAAGASASTSASPRTRIHHAIGKNSCDPSIPACSQDNDASGGSIPASIGIEAGYARLRYSSPPGSPSSYGLRLLSSCSSIVGNRAVFSNSICGAKQATITALGPRLKTPTRSAALTTWVSLLTKAAVHTSSDAAQSSNTAKFVSGKAEARRRDSPTLDVPHPKPRKESSKKRLTDLLDNNQENLLREDVVTPGRSPTKHILTSAVNRTNGVAVDDNGEAARNCEFMDGVKPLEGSRLTGPFASSNPLAGVFDTIKTPVKLVTDYQSTPLKSPLADLPNCVMDGSSPHSRPEKPVVRKRKEDWLTSLSASKRRKLAAKMAASDDEVTPKKKL